MEIVFEIIKNDFCCKKFVAICCCNIWKQGTMTNHVIFGALKVKSWLLHNLTTQIFELGLSATNQTSRFPTNLNFH